MSGAGGGRTVGEGDPAVNALDRIEDALERYGLEAGVVHPDAEGWERVVAEKERAVREALAQVRAVVEAAQFVVQPRTNTLGGRWFELQPLRDALADAGYEEPKP